jgi:capsular exopolysaccharide synthesis family protein
MSQQPTLITPSALSVVTPADVWRIVRKRLGLIIACFIVFGLGGTGALVAWYYLAPSYTAVGTIEVEPGQGQVAGLVGIQQQESVVPVPLFEAYVQAQVLAIRSPRVLDAVIEEIKKKTELAGRPLMFEDPNASHKLGLALEVVHQLNTQTINVILSGRDQVQLQLIVSEILKQYTLQMKADREQRDGDRQHDLTLERESLKKQLDDLGRRLASYRGESNLMVVDERFSEQLARLTVVVRQLSDAQVALAETNAAWNQFQELKKLADEAKDYNQVLLAFPEIMEQLRKDDTITNMSGNLARVNQELMAMKQRFGEKHDAVRRLAQAAQGAKNDYEARQNEVLGQLFQQVAATLKSKNDRARATEAELHLRVDEARAAAVDNAKLTAEFRGREEEYHRVQLLYNTVMDGLERMRISSALTRPNVQARYPAPPVDPSEPRLWIYIPAAILFSLLLGLGLSLVLELLDTRIRTPVDVTRQVGVPLLANIPDLSEDERLSLDTNIALVSQRQPQSLMAESFRQLRTSLLFASDQPVRSLLITSPNPGDGKSTVAANLAIAMAHAGSRVLLIDANFRRPSLGRVFDVPETVGLSNVLVGVNTIAEAVQATSVENLDVLPGGVSPPSPAELLGSQSMRQLIVDQGKAYDRVIIDGAPMLVVADNYLLADIVDGIVLVFAAGANTRGMAQRTVRQVLALRGRVFGGVLNRVRATKGGYFRETYQAYYDYSGTACPVDVPVTARAATGPSAEGRPQA